MQDDWANDNRLVSRSVDERLYDIVKEERDKYFKILKTLEAEFKEEKRQLEVLILTPHGEGQLAIWKRVCSRFEKELR